MTHDDAGTPRTAEERQADHAAIDRLADELLPALVAKLGASGLGELDVREDGWHVRLRMPVEGRGARRSSAPGRGPGMAGPGNPSARAGAGPGHHGSAAAPADATVADAVPTLTVATAPAVGFFRPSPDLAAGTRVRAGDRLGMIDVLGVGRELVAPADGIVGPTLVAPGDPVEYGQGVVEIELPAEPGPGMAEGA